MVSALILNPTNDTCHGCHSSGSQQLGGSPDPPDPESRLMCSIWPVLGHAQGIQRHGVLVLTPGGDSGLESIQNDHPSGFPGAESVLGLRTSVLKLRKSWTNARKPQKQLAWKNGEWLAQGSGLAPAQCFCPKDVLQALNL